MTKENIIIGLHQDLVCKTTGWQNNCGLNCLTHFLYSKLKSHSLQKTFNNNKAYTDLLKTFQEYYKLEKTPNWEEIQTLLESSASPIMQEVYLAPVLRKHLGKILLRDIERIWETEGSAAFSEYFLSGRVNDISNPVYEPNKKMFIDLKSEYDHNLEKIEKDNDKPTPQERNLAIHQLNLNKIQKPTEQQILDQVKFERKNQIEYQILAKAKEYWFKKGAENYTNYMGDINNQEMVSVEQLNLLCQELGIALEVYTPKSIELAKQGKAPENFGAQNVPDKNRQWTWTMKVFNSGVHWEYEEPEKNIKNLQEHNQFYSSYQGLKSNPTTYQNMVQAKMKEIQPPPRPLSQAPEKPVIRSSPIRKEPILLRSSREETKTTQGEMNLSKAQKKLRVHSEKAMHSLFLALEKGVKKGNISDEEKKTLFEFYFDAISEEIKKGPSMNTEKIQNILKEIKKPIPESKKSMMTEKSKKPKI